MHYLKRILLKLLFYFKLFYCLTVQEQYPEIAAKIDDFIKQLSSILKVETPFNIVSESNVIPCTYDRHTCT